MMDGACVLVFSGKPVKVDVEDVARIKSLRWHVNCFYRGKTGSKFYVYSRRQVNGVRSVTLLHRWLIDAPPEKQVDHINGDPLDCRKSNLRLCTAAENTWNRGQSRGESRYKGVHRKKRSSGWYAEITAHGITHRIGRFETEREAAEAYDIAAKDIHGEFARRNFPDDQP